MPMSVRWFSLPRSLFGGVGCGWMAVWTDDFRTVVCHKLHRRHAIGWPAVQMLQSSLAALRRDRGLGLTGRQAIFGHAVDS